MSKYRAIRTEIDGIMFDSKKEANKYNELRLMERAGIIKDLRLQVPFVLIQKSKHGRQIVYKADFVYYDNDLKKQIVMDVKGVKTPVYKLKKRILAEQGIEITEV